MRAARSTARPSTRGCAALSSGPIRSRTSPICMPTRTPGRSGSLLCAWCSRKPNRTAALGVSKVRKQPSPAQSIMRPPDSIASRRTCARWRAMSSLTAVSPRCVFKAVEFAKSAKTKVRMREVPGSDMRDQAATTSAARWRMRVLINYALHQAIVEETAGLATASNEWLWVRKYPSVYPSGTVY